MNPAILSLLAFLAGTLAVIGIYSIITDLFLGDRSRISKRVDKEFRKRQLDRVRKSTLFKNLGIQATDAAAGEENESASSNWLETIVEQSGLYMTPRKLMTLMAIAGLVGGALFALISQSLIWGTIMGVVGAWGPLGYVYFKRKARLAKLTSQLPDAFELMARVVRAGQTAGQAIQAVSDEFEQPLSTEFAYCYEQQNLGLPPELALRDLARRTGLVEIKIFVLALLVQQQSGGNLAELLDKLAAIIRERYRISGKIKAVTAEGRAQAAVLLALPPALLGIIYLLNQDYAQVLFKYPYLLVGMFVFELLGAMWIRKIVNFDF